MKFCYIFLLVNGMHIAMLTLGYSMLVTLLNVSENVRKCFMSHWQLLTVNDNCLSDNKRNSKVQRLKRMTL